MSTPLQVELQLKDLPLDGQPSGWGWMSRRARPGQRRQVGAGWDTGLGSLPCKRRTEGSGAAQVPPGKGRTRALGHLQGRALLPHTP